MGTFKSKETTTIDLPGGKITALTDGILIHARGIRYATAARFHKPQPVSSWTETQGCTQPAPSCPQNKEALMIANGPIGKGRAHSEDCLRVSVVAPVKAQNAPVMVYLHGGAYITGGGDYDAYTPWDLARRGVVAVTVTYRLGLFGYLPIPGVAAANLGLLDQIEALKWVKKNAEAFAGDAENSAGGDSIYCLLVADGTEDLFKQAILQSVPIPSRLHERNRVEMIVAESRVVQQFFAKNPYDCPVEDLLVLQEETIKVGAKYSDTLANYAPIFGSYLLPPDYELPERIPAAAKKKWILLAITEHEGTPFAMLRGSMELEEQITRDDFRDSINEMHQQVEAAIGGSAPMAVFSWYPKGNDGLKAAHCIDLPFLLGDWSSWKAAPMLHGEGDVEAIVERVGAMVKDMWIAFVRGEDLGRSKFIIDENFQFPQENFGPVDARELKLRAIKN